MHKSFAVFAAMLFATSAAAQTYQPDSGASQSSEYGDLLKRAAQGIEPSQAAVIEIPQAAPKAVSAKPAIVERLKDRPQGEFLHEASEYSKEPHKVRLVDRSGFSDAFLPTDVPNTLNLQAGSIYIDVKARQLYFAKSATVLRRYGVAVGKAGAAWKGEAVIGRTARWPDWRPTDNIRRENRKLPAVVKGGSNNPLGARALYLYQDGADTLYRIHGTNAPSSIGKSASHGCIRMVNEDVIELHALVKPGARVIVR